MFPLFVFLLSDSNKKTKICRETRFEGQVFEMLICKELSNSNIYSIFNLWLRLLLFSCILNKQQQLYEQMGLPEMTHTLTMFELHVWVDLTVQQLTGKLNE